MKLIQKLCVSAFLVVLVGCVVACGSDDSNNGGGSSAKLESCKQVCAKQATAKCPISLPLDACNQICDAHAQASSACQDALKAVSDCELTQADVCAIAGCDAQETAYQQACQK